MKKRYFLATSALAIVTLAACGETAEPVTGTTDESNLTVKEVFEKAIERQQSLTSVHADIDMKQDMEIDLGQESFHFSSASNLSMDATQNPLSMYMTGTIAMDYGGENMEMPIEMYMTASDGFYMLNSETNEWMLLPSDQYEAMLQDNGIQADASEQLEQLQQFVDDFEFKQDDQHYLLTLQVDGDKFKEFVFNQVGASIDESAYVDQAAIDSMEFEDSKYVITINKETFDTEKIIMDLTVRTNTEGQSSTVDNEATIVYSKFDEVGEVTVPNEVKNKAISP